MSHDARSYGGATLLGRASGPSLEAAASGAPPRIGSPELTRALAEVTRVDAGQ